MTISDADTKLLWGRAAGLCSICNEDLTIVLESKYSFNIGEMAHVIARKPGGPRARSGAGPDTYGNLILLCPTCHRKIDKAPEGTYTEETLHDLKCQHEKRIRQIGSTETFSNFEELKERVSKLLQENHQIWKELGPESETAQTNPISNMHTIWDIRKIDRIIPNNLRIINLIEHNAKIVPHNAHAEFLKFKVHAEAFEKHQYHRLDKYPLFPRSFAETFQK